MDNKLAVHLNFTPQEILQSNLALENYCSARFTILKFGGSKLFCLVISAQ